MAEKDTVMETEEKEVVSKNFIEQDVYKRQNRTRDLRTTNATLYRLSHSSLFHLVALANLVYIIMGNQICQQHF